MGQLIGNTAIQETDYHVGLFSSGASFPTSISLFCIYLLKHIMFRHQALATCKHQYQEKDCEFEKISAKCKIQPTKLLKYASHHDRTLFEWPHINKHKLHPNAKWELDKLEIIGLSLV